MQKATSNEMQTAMERVEILRRNNILFVPIPVFEMDDYLELKEITIFKMIVSDQYLKQNAERLCYLAKKQQGLNMR